MPMFNKKRISDYGSPESVGPDPHQQQPPQQPEQPQEEAPKKKKFGQLKSEYIPGQDSLEGPKKEKKSGTGIMLALFGGIMVLALVALLSFQYLSSDNTSGRATVEDPARVREMEALRAAQEAEQKLALTEHRYNEAINQMEDLIAQRVEEELARREPKSDMSEELAKQLRAINQSQENMRAEMARLSAQKKEEELKPREGSSRPTISFNMIEEVKEKQRLQEEKILAAQNAEPDIDVRMGLQVGNMIPAKLDNAIYSSTLLDGYWVSATTTEDFEIMKGYTLPKGVHFLGKAKADMDSRRIIVQIEQLQYNQSTVKVKGMLLDRKGSPGLVSKYVDPLNQAMFPILLSSFASATADALQDMTGYYNRIDGSYYERPDFDTGNAALQGASDALDDVSKIIARRASSKKPVIIVRSGIDVKVQISDKLTMDKLIESGVVRPVRPSY